MKMYVTSKFTGTDENKDEIEALCQAVSDAGFEDFSFIRDVEKYGVVFETQQEVWSRAWEELKACDALLVDVTVDPTGGRVVECGMAFAWCKPIFVIAKQGVKIRPLFGGVAERVILYDEISDITFQLKEYLKENKL